MADNVTIRCLNDEEIILSHAEWSRIRLVKDCVQDTECYTVVIPLACHASTIEFVQEFLKTELFPMDYNIAEHINTKTPILYKEVDTITSILKKINITNVPKLAQELNYIDCSYLLMIIIQYICETQEYKAINDLERYFSK